MNSPNNYTTTDNLTAVHAAEWGETLAVQKIISFSSNKESSSDNYLELTG